MSLRARRPIVCTIVLAAAVPLFADISETVVLQSGSTINMDTGAVASSGGDLLWNGTNLVPQGAAKTRYMNNQGLQSYSAWGASLVAAEAAGTRPVPITQVAPGAFFVVVTNSAKNAKAIVLSSDSGRVAIRFTTYGAADVGAPAIDEVLNNSSVIPVGYPNAGVAPSSIIVVKGKNLADPGTPTLQSSAAPGIPLTLNGASVTVVVNGVTTHPALYYTSPTQLAGVLPAATPVGTGMLTVTYRDKTSAPSLIQVVPTALGINNFFTNSGAATDAVSGSILTFTNSGTPGQIIVLWATGLGSDPADSDTTYTTTPHAVATDLKIYIGGQQAEILYAGASTFPGVNQINLKVPDPVPTGCWVPVAAIGGGVASNSVTIPVQPGGGPCIDAPTGLSGTHIVSAGGQTWRQGLVGVLFDNTPASTSTPIQYTANAAFEKITGVYDPPHSLSPGACIVEPITPSPIPSVTALDAGALKVAPPSGAAIDMKQPFKGTFLADLNYSRASVIPGTYTFTASGGADVGPFTATVQLADPLFVWSNQAAVATVDRTSPLTIKWNGGNPGTYVYITAEVRAPLGESIRMTCLAVADDHQFTIPTYILAGMPVGSGGMQVQNFVPFPLQATGIDVGVAAGYVGYGIPTTFQHGPPSPVGTK